MREGDRVRIQHMIDAANQIARFVSGRKRSDLDSDQMLLFALVRAIEIIGEAASRVSDDVRAATPTIPWKSIVGMRNRVIHAYFDVDADLVWKAAVEEVPPLVPVLLLAQSS